MPLVVYSPQVGRWGAISVLIAAVDIYLLRVPPVLPTPLSHWWPALIFAVWAVVALGTIARLTPFWTPYHWRPLTIALGAVITGLAIFIGTGPAAHQRIDLWMTALIGIVIVTIIARFLPGPWARRWLGSEGRHGIAVHPPR